LSLKYSWTSRLPTNISLLLSRKKDKDLEKILAYFRGLFKRKPPKSLGAIRIS
jgi:hypothetical protein